MRWVSSAPFSARRRPRVSIAQNRIARPPKSQMVARILRLLRKRDVAYYAKRHTALCMYRLSVCPSNLCRLVGGVCFFFFSRWFFFRRKSFSKKTTAGVALFFVCVDARQPSKRGKSLSYIPINGRKGDSDSFFFCLLVRGVFDDDTLDIYTTGTL